MGNRPVAGVRGKSSEKEAALLPKWLRWKPLELLDPIPPAGARPRGSAPCEGIPWPNCGPVRYDLAGLRPVPQQGTTSVTQICVCWYHSILINLSMLHVVLVLSKACIVSRFGLFLLSFSCSCVLRFIPPNKIEVFCLSVSAGKKDNTKKQLFCASAKANKARVACVGIKQRNKN